jgi:hypothetical protein
MDSTEACEVWGNVPVSLRLARKSWMISLREYVMLNRWSRSIHLTRIDLLVDHNTVSITFPTEFDDWLFAGHYHQRMSRCDHLNNPGKTRIRPQWLSCENTDALRNAKCVMAPSQARHIFSSDHVSGSMLPISRNAAGASMTLLIVGGLSRERRPVLRQSNNCCEWTMLPRTQYISVQIIGGRSTRA